MKYFKYSIAFLIIFSSSQNSFQLPKFLNLLQSQDSLTMFLWTLSPSVPPPFQSLIPRMCFSSHHFCNIFLTVTRHHLLLNLADIIPISSDITQDRWPCPPSWNFLFSWLHFLCLSSLISQLNFLPISSSPSCSLICIMLGFNVGFTVFLLYILSL